MPAEPAAPFSASNFMPRLIDAMSARHSIENIDTTVWIRWAIVLAVWLAIAFWHHRQQSGFHSFLRGHKQKSEVGARLYQLAQNRSFEVLMLCAFIFFGMIYHDTRIRAMEQNATANRAYIADSEQVIAAYDALVALRETELQEARTIAGMDETQQAALDALKGHYENLYINYYVLQRCNTNSKADYHVITSALMRDLARLNAPAAQQQKIHEAAQGSHRELYATLECNSPEVKTMAANMRSYLDSVITTAP